MILQSEIISHLLVTFIYFLLVSVLRWSVDINLLWLWPSLTWLWLGALLGTFFLDIDHFLYWFYLHPETEDSKEAREIWERKGIGGWKELKLLLEKSHKTHNRLIFHTATFQVILLPLSFYILSSGGSVFASAFVMAINLHLLKDGWQVYKNDKPGFCDLFFWQIRGIPVEKYLDPYLFGVSLVFLGLTILLF